LESLDIKNPSNNPTAWPEQVQKSAERTANILNTVNITTEHLGSFNHVIEKILYGGSIDQYLLQNIRDYNNPIADYIIKTVDWQNTENTNRKNIINSLPVWEGKDMQKLTKNIKTLAVQSADTPDELYDRVKLIFDNTSPMREDKNRREFFDENHFNYWNSSFLDGNNSPTKPRLTDIKNFGVKEQMFRIFLNQIKDYEKLTEKLADFYGLDETKSHTNITRVFNDLREDHTDNLIADPKNKFLSKIPPNAFVLIAHNLIKDAQQSEKSMKNLILILIDLQNLNKIDGEYDGDYLKNTFLKINENTNNAVIIDTSQIPPNSIRTKIITEYQTYRNTNK